MTHPDEQLDRWLRDVDVPIDLHARLLELPPANEPVGKPSSPRAAVMVALCALAASVVGLALWATWSAQPPAVIAAGKTTEPVFDLAEWKDSIRSVSQLVDETNRQAQLGLLQLQRAKLASQPSGDYFATDQSASLIVGLCDSAALDWGASRDWVARDMTRVIDRFPGSGGAAYAQDFLAKQKLQ